jgi:hypothetical protein
MADEGLFENLPETPAGCGSKAAGGARMREPVRDQIELRAVDLDSLIAADHRGFTASPAPGTPQGLAVYQNGVRINESFGDVVNWAFIPEMAVSRASLVPNNPTFRLNAIGGALSIEMKNGFTYQDKEAEATIGSYGRRQAPATLALVRRSQPFPSHPRSLPATRSASRCRSASASAEALRNWEWRGSTVQHRR